MPFVFASLSEYNLFFTEIEVLVVMFGSCETIGYHKRRQRISEMCFFEKSQAIVPVADLPGEAAGDVSSVLWHDPHIQPRIGTKRAPKDN